MKAKSSAQLAGALHTSVSGAPHNARRSRLGVEITFALCVKLLLLLALHQAWFSHPQSKHLTEGGVAAALVGPVTSPLPREEHRDGSGY